MSTPDLKHTEQEQQKKDHGEWSDQTVDAIAGFVVVTCLTLMALWYVMS